MSEPYPEVNEKLWEDYLSECRAADVRPTMSDYGVFLQDIDDYEVDENYER